MFCSVTRTDMQLAMMLYAKDRHLACNHFSASFADAGSLHANCNAHWDDREDLRGQEEL